MLKCCLFQEFFSPTGRLCSGGKRLTEQMWFLPLSHTERSWHQLVICSVLLFVLLQLFVLQIVIMSSVDSGWCVFDRCWQISMEEPIRVLHCESNALVQKLGLCLKSLIFFSPRRVSPFLPWGHFHARSRFARSTIPEKKWGTTRSLGRNKNAFYWLIGERTKLQRRTQLQRYKTLLSNAQTS